jgi:hypothetical protein
LAKAHFLIQPDTEFSSILDSAHLLGQEIGTEFLLRVNEFAGYYFYTNNNFNALPKSEGHKLLNSRLFFFADVLY